MRTIIAGSRAINSYEIVRAAVEASGFNITSVISGRAPGVDRWGEFWASKHEVPCQRYPADWRKYGREAGFRRNEEMANSADALIAIWDGNSRGTRHMIATAKRKGLQVYIWMVHQ